MNLNRVRLLKKGPGISGPVVYWMSRDQRIHDNWALVFAAEKANGLNASLIILFCIVPDFLGAGLRHYDFMIKGLGQTRSDCLYCGIPFVTIIGSPEKAIPAFIKTSGAAILVTDFDPLKIKRDWKNRILPAISADTYEVDAHNIVPCWHASDKLEYGAYTIRPKIKKLLGSYLEDFPDTEELLKPFKNKKTQSLEKESVKIDEENLIAGLKINNGPPAVSWIKPGYRPALDVLGNFLQKGIYNYNEHRNDPSRNAQSGLSPYIHFGQISAQRIALEVLKLDIDEALKEPFLEELIVRRELSDNYCYYNENYGSFDGFPSWAKETLNVHRHDRREYLYSLSDFEGAKTHDGLWNSAQLEMVKTGKMHGYMRMYWAKKILEWTASPEQALEYAIYLNDKYSLDGRDPNGYTGIAWSIGGVHDRPWQERDIFGKIRYMSYDGCRRKFDIKSYIDKIGKL
jgi:deoxyribodipyrimidine photo-lyase